MRPWNRYNISLQIAGRLNGLFSKAFVFNTHRTGTTMYVDAFANGMNSERSHVHMIVQKVSETMSTLEMYFNFNNTVCFSEYNEEQRRVLAYSLGEGLVVNYRILPEGIVFFLNESLEFDEYEDRYEYVVNGKRIVKNWDFPLCHYFQSEYELERQMCFDEGLHSYISELKRNGRYLFNLADFKTNDEWGILHIRKTTTGYDVDLETKTPIASSPIFRNCIMSHLGQCSIMEMPAFPILPGQTASMDIYYSAYVEGSKVRIERLRNYGMTPKEIAEALPYVVDAFPTFIKPKNIDWSNRIICDFVYSK